MKMQALPKKRPDLDSLAVDFILKVSLRIDQQEGSAGLESDGDKHYRQ